MPYSAVLGSAWSPGGIVTNGNAVLFLGSTTRKDEEETKDAERADGGRGYWLLA